MVVRKIWLESLLGIALLQAALFFLPVTKLITSIGTVAISSLIFLMLLKKHLKGEVESVAPAKPTLSVISGLPAPIQGPQKLDFDEKVHDNLFLVAETMGFDTQQISWLSKDIMKTFNQISKIFTLIEENSHQNAASTEEITASINELSGISAKMRDNILNICLLYTSRCV